MDGTYTGWIRLPGQTWRAVVSAPDEDAAWRLLLQHVDRLREKMIDLYVSPASVDPRGRRRPRTRSQQKRLDDHHLVPNGP